MGRASSSALLIAWSAACIAAPAPGEPSDVVVDYLGKTDVAGAESLELVYVPAPEELDDVELVRVAQNAHSDTTFVTLAELVSAGTAPRAEPCEGDGCVAGARERLLPWLAVIVARVAVQGGLFFVRRTATTSTARHVATVGVRAAPSPYAYFGLYGGDGALGALRGATLVTMGATSELTNAMQRVADELDVEATRPCPPDRRFEPERTDEVTLCLSRSGAPQCTSRFHHPCAGTHTHGFFFESVVRGERCTERMVQAVRCDGPLLGDPTASCDDLGLTGVVALCTMPTGPRAREVDGVWDGSQRLM